MDYLKISTAVLLLVVSVSGRGVYLDQGSSYKVYSSLDDLAKQNHYYEIPSGINNHDLNTENHKEEEESEEYDDDDLISQNQQQQEEDQQDQNGFDDQNQQEDQQQQEVDNEFKNQQQQKERDINEKNATSSEAFQDSLEVMPLRSEPNKYDVSKNQRSDDAVNPKESDDKIQEGNGHTKPNYSNENSNKDNLVNDKEEGVDGVIIHTNIDAKDSVSNESDILEQGGPIQKEVNNSESSTLKPVGEKIYYQTSNNDKSDLTTTPFDTTTPHNKYQNHHQTNGPLEGDNEQEEQFTKRTISTTTETQDEKEVFTTEQIKTEISSTSSIEADVTSLRSYSQHKEIKDGVQPDNADNDTEQSFATSNEDLDESTVHNCGNYENECKQREFTERITTVSVTDEGDSRANITEHIEKEENNYNHDITVSASTQGDSLYKTTIENKDNNNIVIEQSTFASILTTNEIDEDIIGKHTTAYEEIQDDNTQHDLSTPRNVDKEIDSVGESDTISRENTYNSGTLDSQNTEIESVDDREISTIGIESENTKKVTKFTEPEKTTASVTKKDIMVEIDYTTAGTSVRVDTSSEKRENSNGGERIPVPEFVPQMKPNGPWNLPGRPWSHPHGSWDRHSGRWGQDYDQYDYDNYGPWSHNNPWDRHRPGPHHWPRSHQNYGHNDRSQFPSKGGR